jgi:hypothetical protein
MSKSPVEVRRECIERTAWGQCNLEMDYLGVRSERDTLLARAEKAEAEAKDNSEAWRNARSLAMRLEAENAALKARVEKLAVLAKREHYYCEDCWYSCPKAQDGCCDERSGDKCRCGADEHNAEVAALAERSDGTLADGEKRDGGCAVCGRVDEGDFYERDEKEKA